MRNPGSYLVSTDPDPTKSLGGKHITETDYFWCCHCGRHTAVKPMCDPADVGGTCTLCWTPRGRGLICPQCVGKPCVPFMKRLEMDERRDRFRRSITSW